MSLYPIDKSYTKYLIAVLNSTFLSHYQFNFINNTVSIQINDIRQLPIIIPTENELKEFEDIFNRAVSIQKKRFSQLISEDEAEKELDKMQKELDEKVLKLYGLE
jgi:hypothetical protein